MMLLLANGFAERGYDVCLIFAELEKSYLAQISPEVKITQLPASNVIATLPGLLRYLKSEQPDVVLSTVGPNNIIASFAKWMSRVQFRLYLREAFAISPYLREVGIVKRNIIRLLMLNLYPKSNGIIAISKGVADDLSCITGIPESRINVIYNPVEAAEIAHLAAKKPDHAWLEDGQQPVILGVGRLCKQKDFLTLIRAFSLVHKERALRLIILGEGEERSNLEKLIRQLDLESAVSMPGWVDNPFAYMSRAAVFVLSSAWEGYGNVLVEAMAAGASVISTNCPSGPSEILENGKWGRLVPVGDSGAMADAILAVLDSTTDKNSLIMRANQFDLYSQSDKYLKEMGLL